MRERPIHVLRRFIGRVMLAGSVIAVSSGSPLAGATFCSGTPIPQTVTTVTHSISSVAPGVVVQQLTNSGGNGATYIDIPSYSAAANSIIYNHLTTPNEIISADPTGTGAQLITGVASQDAFFTFDGTQAYYLKGVGPGEQSDIFAIHITQIGACTDRRVTSLNMVPVDPSPQVEVSTSSKLPDGTNAVAFAPGSLMQRVVLETGVILDSPTNPPDLYQGSTYHRIRLNPVFPQWVAYKRSVAGTTAGTPETWLYNFQTHQLFSLAPLGLPVGHQVWSPNGLQLGYINSNTAQWSVVDVFNPDGTLRISSAGTFTNTVIGPSFKATGLNADYCNWAPDSSVFACSSGAATGIKIYLMSLDGTRTKFLSNADARELTVWGVPEAHFFIDDVHLIFNSDRTGSPEVYTLTGFTPTIP